MRWLLVLLLALPLAADELRWRDWSPETLAQAKAEDRLVLLDLEAVWCHWCHVMDETTYRDPRVRERLEKHFVLVKVDQDARPDLSLKYEDYGWPATIMFAPDGSELARRAGYLNPDEMVALLDRLIKDRQPVPDEEEGMTSASQPAGPGTISPALRAELVKRHFEHYDGKQGGWSFVHKFLNPDCLEYALARGDKRSLQMARQTLNANLNLIDPVWGGVDQYSDSGIWTSPHYEKIMSTQTGNLRTYALAYAQLKDPRHLKAVDRIASYLTTFLRSPEGAFYVSQDADVKPGEHSLDYYKLNDRQRRARGVPRLDRNLYSRENGWVIEALAESSAYASRPRHLQLAVQAAEWLLQHRALPGGGFAHGEKDAAGPFLTDTLYPAKGLLALYGVTGDRRWLREAQRAGDFLLTFSTSQGFESVRGGVRQREENGEVVRFLRRLADATGDKKYREAAAPAYAYLSNPEVARRFNTAAVLLADREYLAEPLHIVVTGSKSDPRARALFAAATRVADRTKRVEWLDPAEGDLPNPDSAYPSGGDPVAYVCTKGRCRVIDKPDAIDRAAGGK